MPPAIFLRFESSATVLPPTIDAFIHILLSTCAVALAVSLDLGKIKMCCNVLAHSSTHQKYSRPGSKLKNSFWKRHGGAENSLFHYR